jgi:hypothetical protein
MVGAPVPTLRSVAALADLLNRQVAAGA